MAYLGLLIYFTAFLLEINIWLPALQGIALLEWIMVGNCVLLLPAVSDGRAAKLFFQCPQTLLLGAFFCWSIVSVLYAGLDVAFGLIGYMLIKYFIIYCMIVLALNTLPKIKGIMILLVFLGVLIALNGFIQMRDGVDLVGQTPNWRGAMRWIGVFDGSNGLALVFVTLLGFSLGFALLKDQGIWRIFGLMSSAVLTYAVFLTGSRGGFVGFLFVLLSYLFIKIPRLKLRTFIPLAIVIFVLGLALKPTEEGRGLGQSTTSERIELFHQGLQMIKAHPLKGVGSGEYEHSNPVHKQAHNLWLQQMAETGAIGATIYALMYFCAIRSLVFFIKKERNNDLTAYNVGVQILIGAIGFLTCAFFLTVSYVMPYTILALITSVSFVRGECIRLSAKDIINIGIFNMGLLITIYILVQLFFIVFK
ncbi:MAG: O-antigen ligase family protein [Desulfobulbaceae bacterium]|nr:O-antigen ligase family protein [Desulfobulbaceae bacterium]